MTENQTPTPNTVDKVDEREEVGASMAADAAVIEANQECMRKETDVPVLHGQENDQAWITPPGSRINLSKKTIELKYGEVSLLSNSYSALSGEEGLEVEKEEGRESTICTRETSPETETQPMENHETLVKPPGTKVELPSRKSLPRFSKTAHKTVPQISAQSTRVPPKNQSRRALSNHH